MSLQFSFGKFLDKLEMENWNDKKQHLKIQKT